MCRYLNIGLKGEFVKAHNGGIKVKSLESGFKDPTL